MNEDSHMVKVWDVPTRVFHWLLVALVALGTVTGFLSPEWWMDIHIWLGYGIVVLVVFRLVWGCSVPNIAASAVSPSLPAKSSTIYAVC